jgi:hypothetical protein
MDNFGTLAALVNRVSLCIKRERRLTLVVGSGLTIGAVPGVGAMIDLTEQFVAGENNDDLSMALLTAKRNAKGAAEAYGNYRRIVNEWLPTPGFDLVVQAAVLRAYPKAINRQRWREVSPSEAQEFEHDIEGWTIPPGVAALAELLMEYPDVFGRRIFTPNFDPLLEIAIGKRHGRPLTLSLKTDGSFSSVIQENAIHVVHLHGFWRAGNSDDTRPMLHDPHQLTRSRPTLQNELAEFIQPTSACAIGYGGWDDIFMRTLTHVAKTRNLEVMWAFHESAPDRLRPDSAPVLRRLTGANSVVAYCGIDSDAFFPSLLERVRTSESASAATGGQINMDDINEMPSQSRLTPRERSFDRSPEAASEILRRLDRVLGWRWDQGALGSSAEPELVHWSVRLRRRSIIHAVQARVAASLSAHGSEIVLCLDDLGVGDAVRRTEEFVDYIERLFADVPNSTVPTVVSLEEHLRTIEGSVDATLGARIERLPETPWRILQYYLARSSPSIVDVLNVSKVIDFPIDSDRQDLLDIVRHALERRDGNKLLTPITLWAHLNHLVNSAESPSLMTLGGSDETALWHMWQSVFGVQIAHLFNPRLSNLHQDSGLLRWETGTQLRDNLSRARELPNWDQTGRLIPWLYGNAVLLRSLLDQDYRLPVVAGQEMTTWPEARIILATYKRQAIDALAGAVADFFEPGMGID